MSGTPANNENTVSVGDYFKANIREYGMLIALVVIMIFFQFVTDGVLFKAVNLTNLVLQNSFIVIMALGMLLIIVAGHIDLSVGSIVAFVGAVAAVLHTHFWATQQSSRSPTPCLSLLLDGA